MKTQMLIMKCLECKKEQQVLRQSQTDDLPVCCGKGMIITHVWELVFSV